VRVVQVGPGSQLPLGGNSQRAPNPQQGAPCAGASPCLMNVILISQATVPGVSTRPADRHSIDLSSAGAFSGGHDFDGDTAPRKSAGQSG
jgi:hypothetical protein